MKYLNLVIYSLLLTLFISSCGNEGGTESSEVEEKGLNLSYVDSTVSPSDDFFRFVNGKWIESTEIPGDQGRWGSFNELREATNDDVLAVLKEAAESNSYPEGSDQDKAADFFSVGMDSLLAEKAGIQPLKDYYDEAGSISSVDEIQAFLVKNEPYGRSSFFGFSVFPDLKKSDEMGSYITLAGLGLPDRDYYLKDDEKSKEIREKYVKHVSRMFQLAGESAEYAGEKAASILKIETDLAEARLTKVERRNPNLLYNKMSVSAVGEYSPTINWEGYLSGVGVTGLDSVIVLEPKSIARFDSVVNNYPIEDIQAYLKWNVLNDAAGFLSNEFVAANFDFYGKELRGTEEMRPRWKRVLGVTNGTLGEAIGKLYVDAVFPPEAKAKAKAMVDNIMLAYEDRINGLDWMTDSTKEVAIGKLKSLTVKIGYPDEWRDYSNLNVEEGTETTSYMGNVYNGRKFNFERDLDKLGKPVDKTEWGMSPQTVNAYYNPLFNEIVFPAAILQPPFYNYKADEAVNYGGIGAVIGHEISHGFDDQGSRFDKEGNLKNWWGEEDLTNFKERTGLLVEQYDEYEPLDSVNVNGAFTLGENIGDLGGINSAYSGLQKHFEQTERPGEIDGLTPEQRFFMSWATIWRIKYRDETLRTQILTDPHSPGMYRAMGPLSNMPEFYTAFNVQEGDPMWRPDSLRVKIW